VADQGWTQEFLGAITVCDRKGIILEMNDRSVKTFADQGGKKLIGSNLLDCHSELSRGKVERLLKTQQKNVYTIEKDGVRKLIYQAPWYHGGAFAGLVELGLEIPTEMPHFVRD
jgi:transcriptional regulator with PAS, ATPase and Fis domain